MPNVCRHGRPYNLTCDFCRVESKNRDLDFERRSNTPRDRRAKTPDPFRCDKCGYTTPWREAYIRHQNRHAEAGKVAEDLDTAYRSGNVRDRLRPQPPKPEAKPQSHHQTRPNPQRPSGHTPAYLTPRTGPSAQAVVLRQNFCGLHAYLGGGGGSGRVRLIRWALG